jgi:hypothetical protein
MHSKTSSLLRNKWFSNGLQRRINVKKNNKRRRRMFVEALEGRRLLTAETFSFVDANNDGAFDTNDGDVMLAGELGDGRFDTRKAEGVYDPAIPGAGLVISGTAITVNNDLKYTAEGNLVVNTDLTAGDDIELTSRNGSVLLDDPTITAADDIEIEAALDIVSTDDVIVATGSRSEIELEAGQDILLFGTSVTAVREVELEAGRNIDVGDSAQNQGSITASDPSRGEVELEADGMIIVSDADISAGEDVDIKANMDIFTQNATITAGEDVDIRSRNGSIGDGTNTNTTIMAEEIELRAALDVHVPMGQLTADDEIELKAGQAINVTGAVLDATASSRGEIELDATGVILADDVQLLAGREVEVRSRAGTITAVDALMEALGSSKGEIELRAAGDIDVSGAELRASREVEVKSTGGMILGAGGTIEALGSSKADIELRAAGDIDLTGATHEVSDELEVRSTGGNIDASDATVTADEVELRAVDIILTAGTMVIADDIDLKGNVVIL